MEMAKLIWLISIKSESILNQKEKPGLIPRKNRADHSQGYSLKYIARLNEVVFLVEIPPTPPKSSGTRTLGFVAIAPVLV